MELYTTSFTYPRRSRPAHSPASSLDYASGLRHADSYSQLQQQYANHNNFNSQGTVSSSSYDAVEQLVVSVMNAFGVRVSFAPADQGRAWNFQVSGAYQQVMLARAHILKECPVQNRATIKVVRSEILDAPASPSPGLKSEVRRRLDDIASQTLANIAVVNGAESLSTRSLPEGISATTGWVGLESERVCELVITGHGDSVDLARVRLLVMLDELSGLYVEPVEIDRKLHAMIAGRKRATLQSIQEETATNIYYPSPLQGVVGPELGQTGQNPSLPSAATSAATIWITGEHVNVGRARDMLLNLMVTKKHQVLTRDTTLLPRKMDWMITERADDLKAFMHDNATFIEFPPIGTQRPVVVYGDQRVNIHRTIRSMMQLACQFYTAYIWLLQPQFNVLIPSAGFPPVQAAAISSQISLTTGAEVIFKGMCFEIHGMENEVRNTVSILLDREIVQQFNHEIRFQIELANEHREFISGKKNGKINKIMQTTNVKIKFETLNEHNFLIDISGNDVAVLQGLTLLQEELPAEISFHVPESYHKRIIGVGGRSIQRIMKKYGVYVKFSNAEEFAAMGGYIDNEDNVIARTPAKNAMNLENLKQSVMELVNPKDKDYMNDTVAIPRKYHRTLLGEKHIFIHDIEAKTNSTVRFPDKEKASDMITIFGPESQIHIAATMLLDHVPFEAAVAVPPHPELTRICTSPDFTAFVERIKEEYQVIISPPGSPSDSPSECWFRFRCQRSNSDHLSTTRELLDQFLVNHNVHLYPSVTPRTHQRMDSFTDAFPHFDSKVLSTARTRHQNSADLGRPSEAMIDRRLRMASSSPDVKALFNNPAPPTYIYHLEEEDDFEPSSNYVPGPSNEIWGAPMAPIGSGLPNRRGGEDALKRGSDSLLEAKLKDNLAKPRSLTNRAQSLDLTYSLTRINEVPRHSGLSRPDSPDTATGTGTGTNGSSSPISTTAPSFPSVYGPPARTAGMPSSAHASRAGFAMDQDAMDEVSRVISNLGL